MTGVKRDTAQQPCQCPYCDDKTGGALPFCQACGAAITRCPRCGKVLAQDETTCPACGARIEETPQGQ